MGQLLLRDASRWTVRHWSNAMAAVWAEVSGGAAVELLKDELPVLTEAEGLGNFFLATDCPADIAAEETLCVKADLVLPWNKVHM